MATYNVQITSKAIRSFTTDLNSRLVAAHRAFDPSTPVSTIRIIRQLLHSSKGIHLYVGGSGATEMEFRYIRIVIEVATGSKAALEKDDLMKRVVECCKEYEGKYAEECEIEVRVNEIDQGDVMIVNALGGRV